MDVQWIKITTDMFDNRKIRHLRRLPEGNSIVLIWVMLLTMAGRCNAGGLIFLTENIPYTAKMLADELDFEENTVNLALTSLEQLGMIDRTEEGFLNVTGWEEHQNVDALERMKEQRKAINKRYYESHKAIGAGEIKTSFKTSYKTDSDGTDKDIEEIRKEKKHYCSGVENFVENSAPKSVDEQPTIVIPEWLKEKEKKYPGCIASYIKGVLSGNG